MRIPAGVIALSVLFGLAAPARAVTLECGEPLKNQPEGVVHWLIEIDYSAGTVHESSVSDDGPTNRPENTYPAQIADNVITWSIRLRDGFSDFQLGRYSGTLTRHTFVVGSSSGRRYDQTDNFSCHVWTPPKQERKF